MRIKGYVGKLPQPRSFEEAGEILRRLFDHQFPKLTPDDWLAAAHRTFKQEGGRLVPTYDVNIAKTMEGIDFERPLPPLWPGLSPTPAPPGGPSASTPRAAPSRRCVSESRPVRLAPERHPGAAPLGQAAPAQARSAISTKRLASSNGRPRQGVGWMKP
jgi:hypothetical protein